MQCYQITKLTTRNRLYSNKRKQTQTNNVNKLGQEHKMLRTHVKTTFGIDQTCF